MNGIDYVKYCKNTKRNLPEKQTVTVQSKFYRKLSLLVSAGLMIFFAGVLTGSHFQKIKIINQEALANEPIPDNDQSIHTSDVGESNRNEEGAPTSIQSAENQNTDQSIKDSLMDPENEYVILARRYQKTSRERAYYYAAILKKITRNENYHILPSESARENAIKLYLGPIKGKKNAEKMLARVKSIREFTNSAILLRK